MRNRRVLVILSVGAVLSLLLVTIGPERGEASGTCGSGSGDQPIEVTFEDRTTDVAAGSVVLTLEGKDCDWTPTGGVAADPVQVVDWRLEVPAYGATLSGSGSSATLSLENVHNPTEVLTFTIIATLDDDAAFLNDDPVEHVFSVQVRSRGRADIRTRVVGRVNVDGKEWEIIWPGASAISVTHPDHAGASGNMNQFNRHQERYVTPFLTSGSGWTVTVHTTYVTGLTFRPIQGGQPRTGHAWLGGTTDDLFILAGPNPNHLPGIKNTSDIGFVFDRFG